MRNPANREAARAWRHFSEALKSSWGKRLDQLNSVKIPDQPKAEIKRRLLTADQQNKVKQLKDKWANRHTKLQAQIDLNLKFHTVEFEEFVLDGHRLEDIKAIYESDLPFNEKNMLKDIIWRQYNAIKGPTKQIINKANQTRQNAQNVINQNERDVANFLVSNKNMQWA